jgi:hypothetical protein
MPGTNHAPAGCSASFNTCKYLLGVLLQAAVTEKPAASRDLNFQFYRNPAEIIADADNQVRQQTT